MTLTWLGDLDIKDFLHLPVVGCDLEDGVGGVLDAGDVDRNYIIRYSLPAHVVAHPVHPEHVSPQPAQQGWQR